MATFKELAEAWIASREHRSGSLGRIRFWVDEFGTLQVDQISEDRVDQNNYSQPVRPAFRIRRSSGAGIGLD